MAEDRQVSSAGHKLGQIVGDWWELNVVYPLLSEVANRLGLFLDNRCVRRNCRAEKVQWPDADNNIVDYDFVLEFGGTPMHRGVPVAFFESFWRRGSRHSKDKARDDTNKLLPMRQTYPTARLLAIAACGEFTGPARDYVRTREVELFLVSKAHIVSAFRHNGIEIDYPDTLGENEKLRIALAAEAALRDGKRPIVAESLRDIAGLAAFQSFASRIVGALTALPQEIRFVDCKESPPMCFTSIETAQAFLADARFTGGGDGGTSYRYEVTYSDGSEFSRSVESLDALRALQHSLTEYARHVTDLALK